MLTYKRYVPSIDLMKYSSYHKSCGDIVKPLFDINNWDSYDKIYVNANKHARLPPQEIISNPIVEWVGKKFLDGVSIKLPDEVEGMYADSSIYTLWMKSIWDEIPPWRKRLVKRILEEATLCRFTFNGELVNYPKIENEDNLVIYDENPFSTNEILKPLNKNLGAFITFIERAHIEDFKIFSYLQNNFNVARDFSKVIFTGDITSPEVNYEKNYFYFRKQMECMIPKAKSREDVLNVVKDCLNILFYTIASNHIFYYAANPENDCFDKGLLAHFPKYLSRNIGKSTDKTPWEIMESRYKTLYKLLHTDDPYWIHVKEELKSYLSITIKEINEGKKWK